MAKVQRIMRCELDDLFGANKAAHFALDEAGVCNGGSPADRIVLLEDERDEARANRTPSPTLIDALDALAVVNESPAVAAMLRIVRREVAK